MIPAPPRPGRGPSVTLPLAYLVTAAGAFVVSALSIAWLAEPLAGHYYHPRLAALTHTVTLGWITLTIMGASYQLVPIVLERPIWSERLAWWQLGFMLTGVVGMVGHLFLAEWTGLLWAAGLVGVGIALHVVNIGRSLRGLPRFTFTARMLVGALVGLALTAGFGLLLGADRVWKFLPGTFFPTLHAHVHLALLGWIVPVVLGVAARVFPMFLLAPEPRGFPGPVQEWGLLVGVPLVVAGLLAAPPLIVPGALAVVLALAGHAWWVAGAWRSRKRPALDWGLRIAIGASLYLAPTIVLALGLALDLGSGPRVALAYAVLALGGWVSMTIVGMMLKIVPFLVWYRVYAPAVGRTPVPTLAAIGWPAAEAVACVLLNAGVVGLALGVAIGDPAWIRGAAVLVALGALAFAGALARVLHHALPCIAHRPPVLLGARGR